MNPQLFTKMALLLSGAVSLTDINIMFFYFFFPHVAFVPSKKNCLTAHQGTLDYISFTLIMNNQSSLESICFQYGQKN